MPRVVPCVLLNWFGAHTKPERSANPRDVDGDEMANAWELTYGFNPLKLLE